MDDKIETNNAREEIHPPAPSSTSSEAASVISITPSTISKSEASRPSTFAKPSGLKPPTKIGRLCSNSAPKPAVPISPRSGECLIIYFVVLISFTFVIFKYLIQTAIDKIIKSLLLSVFCLSKFVFFVPLN